MAQKLTLELVDGQKVEASLIGSFRPDDGEIDILFEVLKKQREELTALKEKFGPIVIPDQLEAAAGN